MLYACGREMCHSCMTKIDWELRSGFLELLLSHAVEILRTTDVALYREYRDKVDEEKERYYDNERRGKTRDKRA